MSGAGRVLAVGGGVVIGAGLLVFFAARGIMSPAPSAPLQPVADTGQSQKPSIDDIRRRGAYLMASMDCHGCHTAKDNRGQPIPGMELAGHPASAPLPEWDPSLLERNILATMPPTLTAFAGPFGVSVAPNITPDPETGIGAMSAEQLIISWRTGKHWQHDRPVMPPMPVDAYRSLTDDDIRALHAFLMTLPPVKNRAPDSRPAPMPPPQG